jgi:hypothetical protein
MIEAGLVSLISSDATLIGIIGTNIYHVAVPANANYPCLSYQVVSSSSSVALDRTKTQTKRIQFDAWAHTYAQVKQIEQALSAQFTGYSGMLSDGTQILSAYPGVVIDTWEVESNTYRVTAEFNFIF